MCSKKLMKILEVCFIINFYLPIVHLSFIYYALKLGNGLKLAYIELTSASCMLNFGAIDCSGNRQLHEPRKQ